MSSWEEDLPLASAWVVHEQRRATGQNLSAAQWMALQQIACEFSTVEGFWTSFEHLPPPSTVFYDGKSSKRVGVPPDARTIESFSIFRAGVLPEWDDPSNKTGGEWYARRSLRPARLRPSRRATAQSSATLSTAKSGDACARIRPGECSTMTA